MTLYEDSIKKALYDQLLSLINPTHGIVNIDRFCAEHGLTRDDIREVARKVALLVRDLTHKKESEEQIRKKSLELAHKMFADLLKENEPNKNKGENSRDRLNL